MFIPAPPKLKRFTHEEMELEQALEECPDPVVKIEIEIVTKDWEATINSVWKIAFSPNCVCQITSKGKRLWMGLVTHDELTFVIESFSRKQSELKGG